MAPPLPLANMAGTLALSFTAGRAAPATTSPTVQEPTSVPTPPRLPPLPGETEPTEPETTTPETTTPETPESDATVTTEPATPEPEPLEPVEPVTPFDGREVSERNEDYEQPVPPAARLLRSNHRRLMFNLFVGGSKPLRGEYSYFGPDFKTEAAIGGHDPNFRVGGFAVVQMSKGIPFTAFTLAPRVSFNRQIVPNYAFYFTTNVTVGYRASTYQDSGYIYDGYGVSTSVRDRTTLHSAVMGVSWGASVIVAERLLLSFRPLDLEMVVPAPDPIVQLNWSVMGGLGVLWGRTGDDER
jgi:hypothetical protein